MFPSSVPLRWAWIVIALLLTGNSPALAQEKRPFEDLGRYLRTGDTVFVVERTEGASTGVVSRVTPTELFVSVAGQERRLTAGTVGWIEASPDPMWDGALLGGTVGLLVSIFPMVFGCVECGLLGVTGGAVAGAALDAVVAGKHVVYGKPPGLSWRRPVPVSSLDDLWSRVPPGAPISVRDSTLGERRGRFVKASRDALTLETNLGTLPIPAERVRLVRRRSYVPAYWIWTGIALGGVVGAVKEHDPYARHGMREDVGRGVLAGGLVGASVALAAARYTDVYRPADGSGPDVAVRPVVGVGRGVALTARF